MAEDKKSKEEYFASKAQQVLDNISNIVIKSVKARLHTFTSKKQVLDFIEDRYRFDTQKANKQRVDFIEKSIPHEQAIQFIYNKAKKELRLIDNIIDNKSGELIQKKFNEDYESYENELSLKKRETLRGMMLDEEFYKIRRI